MENRTSGSRYGRSLGVAGCLALLVLGSCQCGEDAEVEDVAVSTVEQPAEMAETPAAAAAEDTPLTYDLAPNTWTLVSIETPTGSVPVPASAGAMLVFTLEAVEGTTAYRLDGHAGCNGLGGDYQATSEGELLVASAMGSTDRSCPDEVLAVEDAMTMGLTSVSSYSISGNMLTITFDGGSMTFKAGS